MSQYSARSGTTWRVESRATRPLNTRPTKRWDVASCVVAGSSDSGRVGLYNRSWLPAGDDRPGSGSGAGVGVGFSGTLVANGAAVSVGVPPPPPDGVDVELVSGAGTVAVGEKNRQPSPRYKLKATMKIERARPFLLIVTRILSAYTCAQRGRTHHKLAGLMHTCSERCAPAHRYPYPISEWGYSTANAEKSQMC